MGTIESTIRIHDGVSHVLQNMNLQMRAVLSSFREMQIASSRPIETSAIQNWTEAFATPVPDAAGMASTRDAPQGNEYPTMSAQAVVDTESFQRAQRELEQVKLSANDAIDEESFQRTQRELEQVKLSATDVVEERTFQRVQQEMDQTQLSAHSMVDKKAVKRVQDELDRTTITARNIVDEDSFRREQANIDQMKLSVRAAGEEVEQVNRASSHLGTGFESANGSASNLLGTVRNLASAYIGIQGIQKLVDLSDRVASTTARLELMNDGLQTTDALQKKIFRSAEASRASYLETAAAVSKMGLNAGNAFRSNDELIAFMEQVNKNFVIGGASAEEQKNAMLQLTQAMGAGALRGEELNSILESAPLIARNIETYMGWASGSIKQYAEQGAVTAEVVKNAMLAMADETDARFHQMDLTWAQVMTSIQNRALMASQPILSIINLVAQHWTTIEPIAIAAGSGVLFFAATTWVASGGVGMLTGAVSALWATLMANPLLLIGSLIVGGVVYAIYQWIQSCGSLEVAWTTAMYNLENVTQTVMNAIFYAIQNTVNGAIDLLNSFIRGANQILGIEIEEFRKVTFADTRASEGAAALSAAKQRMDAAKSRAAEKSAAEMLKIDTNQMTPIALFDIANNANKTAKNTGSALDTLNRSEEDLSYLKELASQKSIHQVTMAEIKVDMSGMVNQISQELDLDGVVRYLEDQVEEALLTAAEGSHY